MFTYEVTADGKVYSLNSNWRGYGKRELKQIINSAGYLSVRLMIDGKRKHLAVHVLVAKKFIGERPTGLQVCHTNGNKLDNRVENLRYGTAKENAQDKILHGTVKSGKEHPQYDNTVFVFMHDSGQKVSCTQHDFRMRFKELGQAHVSDICTGKRKKHKGWVCLGKLDTI